MKIIVMNVLLDDEIYESGSWHILTMEVKDSGHLVIYKKGLSVMDEPKAIAIYTPGTWGKTKIEE